MRPHSIYFNWSLYLDKVFRTLHNASSFLQAISRGFLDGAKINHVPNGAAPDLQRSECGTFRYKNKPNTFKGVRIHRITLIHSQPFLKSSPFFYDIWLQSVRIETSLHLNSLERRHQTNFVVTFKEVWLSFFFFLNQSISDELCCWLSTLAVIKSRGMVCPYIIEQSQTPKYWTELKITCTNRLVVFLNSSRARVNKTV